MTLNNKKFKKELVQDNGEIKTFEYEPAPNTKTINQQMTENKEEHLKEWADEAEWIYTGDYKAKLTPKKGYYAKYVVKNKKGKILLRNGGLIMKIEDNYVMLKNPVNNLAWSVQYATLQQIFVWKMKSRKNDENEEAPPELQEAQVEAIQEQKEEEQANAPPPVPARLTDEEAHAILNTAYYEKDQKFGRDKLYATLKAEGHNVTRKQVDGWLKKQALYQLDKTAFEPKDFVVQTAYDVNNVWNVDLVEVDGDKIVLNCVDRFSKYAYSRILRNKTAIQVVNALNSIFRNGGTPQTIVSDNGPEFKSVRTQDFLKSKQIKQFFSTPHQPQSNGLVERFNRTMKEMFKKMTYQKTEQKTVFNQSVLNRILKAYNTSVHSMIEMSPEDAKKEANKEKVRALNEKHLSVGVKTVQRDDVGKGAQVRVSLNKGNDRKTKEFRTKWSEEVFFVKQVIRSSNNIKPIQYKIEDEQGNSIKGLFKREEIQLVPYIENEDKVDVPYTIRKFLQEQGDEIKVAYKGFKSDGDRWIEKTILKNDLGNEVYQKLYDEMNN